MTEHNAMARQEETAEPSSIQEPSSSNLRVASSPDSSSRRMSRSPHPYHRLGAHLNETPGALTAGGDTEHLSPPSWELPKPSSESGTEADDEGFGLLRGLPAPHVSTYSRLLLREQDSDTRPTHRKSKTGGYKRDSSDVTDTDLGVETSRDTRRRRKRKLEVLRRGLETTLILAVGTGVFLRHDTREVARMWDQELVASCALVISLYGLLPLRIYTPGFNLPSWGNAATLPFSPDFDPAPLIYPVLLPVLVAVSLGWECRRFILPNLILSLSSLPAVVIPYRNIIHGFSIVHWGITAIPLLITELPVLNYRFLKPLFLLGLDREALILIFPLQQSLLAILQSLTTTSLLPTEVQLLATGLINLLLFSNSPQAEILTALLWVGGVFVLVTCSDVLHWEVTLARIPSWKFRRPTNSSASKHLLKSLDQRVCQKLNPDSFRQSLSDSDDLPSKPSARRKVAHENESRASAAIPDLANVRDATKTQDVNSYITARPPSDRKSENHSATEGKRFQSENVQNIPARTTSRGRPKRTLEPDLRSFLSLTLAQAKVRKWAYAAYVYTAILFIILGPVRIYVGTRALQGNEPFGWAVGYLFGNIPSLRFWLVRNNFDGWACIPPWDFRLSCHLGWVEHLRRDTFGEAYMRLLISAYYLLVLSVGLALVIRLSTVVAVDTRRKIFHGMMAMMFLPATYIDPAFSALALVLVLAVFLLLDLFRASQLPPISKPLTHFLSPYADGRDHCGPVIVSHIFLLIGCAIPLWLSLTSTSRSGSKPWEGWEVETRDVSMVSGVVCVGMGDAAASLIGRRYGRRKWFWGGGKSIEGSLAFAVAVLLGLLVSKLWLVIGGWAQTGLSPSYAGTVSLSALRDPAVLEALMSAFGKSALAAAGSSFMEAVLTGGNDNVVVPLVLWLLVRGLDI